MKITRFALSLAIAAATASFTAMGAGAQTLADGPGKDTFVKYCSDCHTVDSVIIKRQNADDWRATVQRMSSYGANVPSADEDAVVNYLATYYGLTPPPK